MSYLRLCVHRYGANHVQNTLRQAVKALRFPTYPQRQTTGTSTFIRIQVGQQSPPNYSLLDTDIPIEFFREGSYNFDVAPRNGLQFFQGEYAVTRADDGSRVPYPTIEAAVAEAAYLTGFDRNSDIVFATAYAPLLNVSILDPVELSLMWCG